MARTCKLKKTAKHQTRGYGETSKLLYSSGGIGCGTFTPLLVGGKLCYRNRGPRLVLAMTSPATYRIQRHTRAEPETVHVNKLLPYHMLPCLKLQ